MFQYNEQEENTILCTECDAEFTIHKLDDEEDDVEFCPYCGHALWEEYDNDNEGEDEDD